MQYSLCHLGRVLQCFAIEILVDHAWQIIAITLEVAKHILNHGLVCHPRSDGGLLGFEFLQFLQSLRSEFAGVKAFHSCTSHRAGVDRLTEVLGIEFLHIFLIEIVSLVPLHVVVSDIAVESDGESLGQVITTRRSGTEHLNQFGSDTFFLSQTRDDASVGGIVDDAEHAVEFLPCSVEIHTIEQFTLALQQLRGLQQHHGLLVGLTLQDELVAQHVVLRCRIPSTQFHHGLQVLDVLDGLPFGVGFDSSVLTAFGRTFRTVEQCLGSARNGFLGSSHLP